ncbi:MAG: HEPN domain-containing protein [bacterium]|nr:HEPN domain-containing protein [bacterium]
MITNYVENWFRRADEDLTLIEVILKRGSSFSNPICFHAQQAAEKYLKGFLAYHDLHVRKIHDLEVLVEDCTKIEASFNALQDDARFLNQFYIESRYPDDYIEFSRNDAEKAFTSATKIKNFILEKIK